MEHKFDVKVEVERLRDSMKERVTRGSRVPFISVTIGVAIVIFIVTICVLTLVVERQQDRKSVIGRRRAHHTDPHFTQSLLLNRLSSAVLEAPKPSLSDIFISVKTSRKFHKSRLGVVLATWFQQARDSTYFFTDESDPETAELAGSHLVPTACADDHSRQALCCKMQAELDMFLKTDKRWVLLIRVQH